MLHPHYGLSEGTVNHILLSRAKGDKYRSALVFAVGGTRAARARKIETFRNLFYEPLELQPMTCTSTAPSRTREGTKI